MNSKLTFVFITLVIPISFLIALQSIMVRGSSDETAPGEKREHQEFIFLLQYIGRDYQNAVVDGGVVNEFEYLEILTFCQRVMELYLTFQQNLQQDLTVFQLQQLRQMVYEKADRDSIWDLTRTLIRDLTKQLDLDTNPANTPKIERGQRLYEAGGCGVCHGVGGAGDGYAADGLEPVPGGFRDPTAMYEASPYLFFNVVFLGVSGTAMPSYEQAFSRQDMWDLAFYLLTLREGFDPQLIVDGLDISLEDLAVKSDIELIEEVQDFQSSRPEAQEWPEAAISHTIDFLRHRPETLKR